MEVIGAEIQGDFRLSNRKRGRLDDEFEFDVSWSCTNKRRKLRVKRLDDEFEFEDDYRRKTDPSFPDAECKLPLYLSEYALLQVNMMKNALASFQMSEEEFYVGVSVANTSTVLSAVDNSTTYDITFLAFLPADETTQTFVTKVVVTHSDESHPTTEIQFLYIRIKGVDDEKNNLFFPYIEPDSESDDDGPSSEKLPDSDDGEDSEEDLSESNQKDSEEYFSEFKQKHSKEDLPESNQKGSEEDLSESNQKDSKEDLSLFKQKHSEEDLLESNQKDSEEDLFESNQKDSKEDLSESNQPDSEEDLSESNQKHSKEDLSESNQKDSKEELSEFKQKHSEEDLSELNHKDSEEDLSESNHKDSEEDLSESNQQQDSKEDLCEFNENDLEEDLYKSNKKVSEEEVTRTTIASYFLGGSKLFSQLNKNSKEGSDLSEEIDSFNNDAAKSDGFEVRYYPLMEAAGITGTWLFRYYDIENTTLSTTDMNQLVHLSQLALFVYNMQKNTNFDKIKVLKAMTSGGGGINYNITFEASSHDKYVEIFQTRVVESIPHPYRNVDVVFVRTKGN